MNIVLDTNVLVSGLLTPDGNPAKILNMVLNCNLVVLYDTRIIDEYRLVLRRNKFGFSEDLIVHFMEFIESEGISIIPNPSPVKFKDEDDKKFYEVAIAGNADYIITGNKSHFPKEKFILTPTEFLLKL